MKHGWVREACFGGEFRLRGKNVSGRILAKWALYLGDDWAQSPTFPRVLSIGLRSSCTPGACSCASSCSAKNVLQACANSVTRPRSQLNSIPPKFAVLPAVKCCLTFHGHSFNKVNILFSPQSLVHNLVIDHCHSLLVLYLSIITTTSDLDLHRRHESIAAGSKKLALRSLLRQSGEPKRR
jgi:hypothetical protein